MGLDMYLFATDKTDLNNAQLVDLMNSYSMKPRELAYFRKANAIHKWFVTNVQDGVDDCAPYIVSLEQLAKLRDVCVTILEAASLSPKDFPLKEDLHISVEAVEKAKELLPTTPGFFFGTSDYDNWYFRDLAYAVQEFDVILNNPKFTKQTLFYQASW